MHLKDSRHLRHHAFVIEAEAEEGIALALGWAERELGMKAKANPDIVTFQFGLLSVDDARRVNDNAIQAPIVGDTKVIIIAASRAYHEAQNALLKLFEEPPRGTYVFLVLPTLGSLLPTLRSRVQVLEKAVGSKQKAVIPDTAEEFINMSREKRSVMIKKLANGKDEDERRENRDTAIAIVNGIEALAYGFEQGRTLLKHRALLEDIQILRGHLHDRSAPVRMILEHLSLVLPKNLV